MRRAGAFGLCLALLLGCSDQGGDDSAGAGATSTSGGVASGGGPATGGLGTTGGVAPTGGAAPTGGVATGGASTGGSLPTGGVGGTTTGGAPAGGGALTGGVATGGAPAGGSGGASTGGTEAGGAPLGGETSGGAPLGGETSGGAPLGGETSGGAPLGGAVTGGALTGGELIGGAPTGGVATGGEATGGAGTGGVENPFAHLADSAREVGLLLANRFANQNLSFNSTAAVTVDGGQYKTACEWYGALGVAGLTDSQSLLTSLVNKFDPFEATFVSGLTGGEAHVDRYIFGMVPLEIYLQTGEASYLPLGTQIADQQQVTNQTRGAVDDMFMMTGLQLQAYRATGDSKYIDFMSQTMVDYLDAQQDNGLFFHNVTEARVHWCRGNGWFAAGMAEMMRDLPTSSGDYATIEAGYLRMMEGLLAVQGPGGLWYQVLDLPNDSANWEETSGSAMFTYAMIAGVRRGVLDAATYVPVVEAAWAGLQTKIAANGDVSGICTGTWYHATPQEYMALSRLTGDGHGQAPILWAAAELLR